MILTLALIFGPLGFLALMLGIVLCCCRIAADWDRELDEIHVCEARGHLRSVR